MMREPTDLTGRTPPWARVGDRIHRADCRYAGSESAVPWMYAAELDESEVRRRVASVSWLSLCKVCLGQNERHDERSTTR